MPAAAHCEDDSLSLNLKQTVGLVAGVDDVILGYLESHCVGLVFNTLLVDELNESVGVFGAGELLAEVMKAEAGMYALLEDAAEGLGSLEDEYAVNAAFLCLECGSHACGASADYNYIIIKHIFRLTLFCHKGFLSRRRIWLSR